MVVQVKPPSKRRIGRALEALFREARLLERRRRRRYAAVALLGCVALGAIAYLIADPGAGSPATSTYGPRPALAARQCAAEPTLHPISPRLTAAFAVFRRVQAADVSAPSANTVANPHVVAFLQLDLSCTQLVRTRSGPVWVVPGSQGACVMSGQAPGTIAPQPGQNGVGCDTTVGILQNGEVVRSGQRNGPDLVFGLVPDGNTSVTLTFATGAQQRVPVVNNVVRATVPAGPVTVAFRNAAGARWSLRYPG